MTISSECPLISCICITDNRPKLLLRAIVSFDTQDYPNKELVISYPKDDHETKALVTQIIRSSGLNISVIERNKGISLGRARNEAILKCNGEYICIWDDDDWSNSKRLSHQFESLQSIEPGESYDACILDHIMIYDSTKKYAYISCKFKWGGTLMCRKEFVLQYPYRDSNFLEDNNLIQQLESKHKLKQLSDAYHIYLFVYHGNNAFNNFQLMYLMKTSSQLEQPALQWMQSVTSSKIELLDNPHL